MMTISILRPAIDHAKHNITLSSGSLAYDRLNDEPADNSGYVRVAAGISHWSNHLHIGYTDLSPLTSDQRIKRVRTRTIIRLNSSVPGYGADIRVGYWDQATRKYAGNIERYATSNASTFQSFTGAWKNTPGSIGTEWTSAIVNRIAHIVTFFYTTDSGGANEHLRLSELYIDVDVRDAPTVTGVAVTGYDTTTRPKVSWTFNANADGDLQTGYHVKVFSAAQYGAAGFNPDTTVPSFNSGKQTGPALEYDLTGDLAIGGTYKAYVAVSQDFNGDQWFSDWGVSSSFTITPIAPATPSIVITQDSSIPWLRNHITVTGNHNLLTYDDASFETSIGTWTALTNSTIAVTGTPASHGTQSMRMTATASTNMSARTGEYRVKSSTSYTTIAEVRAATTARSCRLIMYWYDKASAQISTTTGSSVADASGSWTALTVTGSAPGTARYVRVVLEVISAAAGEVHFADKISFHAGSSTTWSIGGMVQDDGFTYVEYAWTTIGQKNLAHPQLWGGGDDEGTANGFYTSGIYSEVEYDLSDRYHGTGSVRWDVLDEDTQFSFGWVTGAAFEPEPTYPLAGVPRRAYSFSVRGRASAAFIAEIFLQPIDKDGVNIGSPTSGGTVTINEDWEEFKVENYTTPVDTVWVRPYFVNTNDISNVSVWFDFVQWQLGPSVRYSESYDDIYDRIALLRENADTPSGRPTIWQPVRGADIFQLSSVDENGVTYLIDQEVPPGYSVLYRARNIATVADQIVSSASSAYVHTMLNPPGEGIWVLSRVIERPAYRMLVNITSIDETQNEEVSTFYPLRPPTPGGWEQRPVSLSDYIGGYDGTMKIVVTDENEFERLRQLISHPAPLWLIFPDFGARYIRVKARGIPRRSMPKTCIDETRRWIREFTLEFEEADRPP